MSKWHGLKVSWDLCVFSYLYSGLVKILSLLFCLSNQDAFCSLCPDWPVYTVLLRDRWRRYKLISCLCLMLWLPSADNRVSASDTVSQLRPELGRTSLLRCNFPCNSFILDFKERVTTNEIKCELEQKTGRGDCSWVASQWVSCYS